MTKGLHIALIGCGHMGSAMLRGWIESESITHITVLDPNATLPNDPKVTPITTAAELPSTIDTLVLAVKPQIITQVAADIAPHVTKNTLILSIAAGTRLAVLEEILEDGHPVIRSMPNTPASIGQGITALCANPHVTAAQKETAMTMLQVLGQTLWIDDEKDMDAVTALSGSGPAYLFYLIEVLAKGGEKLGLPAERAETLARQTVIGSAALAAADTEKSASTLRQNVTSKGGTTEAALNILMDGRLESLFDEALQAAQERSKNL